MPGKSHGQRSLVGCSPWGRKELGTTELLTLTYLRSSQCCRKWDTIIDRREQEQGSYTRQKWLILARSVFFRGGQGSVRRMIWLLPTLLNWSPTSVLLSSVLPANRVSKFSSGGWRNYYQPSWIGFTQVFFFPVSFQPIEWDHVQFRSRGKFWSR